jgi:hypothetical protein
VALYALAWAGMLGFFFRQPVWPAWEKKEAWGFAGLAVLLLAHLFWFRPSGYEFSLSDRLSFFSLVLLSWRAFATRALAWEDFRWPLAVSLWLVSTYGMYQTFKVGFGEEMPFSQVSSTFGHTNMAAQFVGLSLLLLWSIPRPAKGWPWLPLLTSVVSLAYLVFSRGRSALLAFALGAGLMVCQAFWSANKKDRLRYLALGGGALFFSGLLLAGIQLSKGKTPGEIISFSLFSGKSPLTYYRKDVWTQTVKMIQAHPLGVGVDRFAFEFLPFHKQGTTLSYLDLATTPHNEILRYLAEDGIPLSLLFLSAYAWLFWRWRKARGTQLWVLAGPLIFLFSEMVFQFPLQIAPTVFLFALIVGAALAEVWRARPVKASKPLQLWFALFLLAFFVVGGRAIASRVLERSVDQEWAKVGCRMVPSNWAACLNYVRVLLKNREYPQAREEVQAVLAAEPQNYAAMRHMAVVAQRQGDRLEACFYLWKYTETFNGQSNLSDAYELECPYKWRDYFRRKRPSQYYGRQKSPTLIPTLPGKKKP